MSDTSASIQGYLNSLSSLPGSLLYRNTLWWQALPPGQQNQILRLGAAGFPEWYTPTTYWPAMQTFDGSGDYYEKNPVTISNTTQQWAYRIRISSLAALRPIINITAPTAWVFHHHVQTGGRLLVQGWNSAGTPILQIRSNIILAVGNRYYIYFKYNPSTPAVEFRINGLDADDPAYINRVLLAGTLYTGAGSTVRVGADNLLPTNRFFNGDIGPIGWAMGAGGGWNNFMDPDGRPKNIEANLTAAFGVAPSIWQESGELTANRGSLGALTKLGNVQIAPAANWS